MYKDGQAVSDTLQYSVESYVYSNQNKNDNLKGFLNNMMRVCDSMQDYMLQ